MYSQEILIVSLIGVDLEILFPNYIIKLNSYLRVTCGSLIMESHC